MSQPGATRKNRVNLFRFSWKWGRRSAVKVGERTHEEKTEALPPADGVLENGAAVFEQKARPNHSADQERIAYLEKKIQGRGSGWVCGPPKNAWGILAGVWVPHDMLDQIVDFDHFPFADQLDAVGLCGASTSSASGNANSVWT